MFHAWTSMARTPLRSRCCCCRVKAALSRFPFPTLINPPTPLFLPWSWVQSDQYRRSCSFFFFFIGIDFFVFILLLFFDDIFFRNTLIHYYCYSIPNNWILGVPSFFDGDPSSLSLSFPKSSLFLLLPCHMALLSFQP